MERNSSAGDYGRLWGASGCRHSWKLLSLGTAPCWLAKEGTILASNSFQLRPCCCQFSRHPVPLLVAWDAASSSWGDAAGIPTIMLWEAERLWSREKEIIRGSIGVVAAPWPWHSPHQLEDEPACSQGVGGTGRSSGSWELCPKPLQFHWADPIAQWLVDYTLLTPVIVIYFLE